MKKKYQDYTVFIKFNETGKEGWTTVRARTFIECCSKIVPRRGEKSECEILGIIGADLGNRKISNDIWRAFLEQRNKADHADLIRRLTKK